jgi:hypothetical protein
VAASATPGCFTSQMKKGRFRMIPNLTAQEEAAAARRDFVWIVRLQVARVRHEIQAELRRAEWLCRRSRRLIKEARTEVAKSPDQRQRRTHPRSIAFSRRLRLVK